MRARSLLLWLVALALVAAQVLGLMHQMVHQQLYGGGAAERLAHTSEHARADYSGHERDHARDHDHADDHGTHWIAALFSAHSDDSSCRLFDPLQHEGLLMLPALLLPSVLAARFIDFSKGECLARWAALYDARGPPFLR